MFQFGILITVPCHVDFVRTRPTTIQTDVSREKRVLHFIQRQSAFPIRQSAHTQNTRNHSLWGARVNLSKLKQKELDVANFQSSSQEVDVLYFEGDPPNAYDWVCCIKFAHMNNYTNIMFDAHDYSTVLNSALANLDDRWYQGLKFVQVAA